MLFFGHLGLTLGTAAALDVLYTSSKAQACQTPAAKRAGRLRLSVLPEHVDLRILLAGSLLPDIIDKPLGIYILGNTFSNGRIVSHTLLFLAVLALAGWFVYRRWRRTWGLVLAFGTLTHLVFDSMWNRPQTLFWPFMGATFPREDSAEWIGNILHSLFTRPSFYIPEIAGILVLLVFLMVVLRRKSLGAAVTKGKAL